MPGTSFSLANTPRRAVEPLPATWGFCTDLTRGTGPAAAHVQGNCPFQERRHAHL